MGCTFDFLEKVFFLKHLNGYSVSHMGSFPDTHTNKSFLRFGGAVGYCVNRWIVCKPFFCYGAGARVVGTTYSRS